MKKGILEENGIIPLSKEEKEEREITDPSSTFGYKIAQCAKAEGIPEYIRYQIFETLGVKKVHVLCPSSGKGCSQLTENPDFDLSLPCAQKDSKDVIVSDGLTIKALAETKKSVAKTASDTCDKFNSVLRKLNAKIHK